MYIMNITLFVWVLFVLTNALKHIKTICKLIQFWIYALLLKSIMDYLGLIGEWEIYHFCTLNKSI